MKLNVALGITDHLAKVFKGTVIDYIKYFKGSQGAFKGVKATYQPKDGMVDDPSKRSNILVVTTVDEKLKWLSDNSSKYINALFSQEATNASGTVKATLTVDGVKWGEFSALELLRLKSLLDTEDLRTLYALLPVRADNRVWNPTDNPSYGQRAIFQTTVVNSVSKSILKETYILQDPNITGAAPSYKAVTAIRDTVIDIGDATFQEYSGEILHVERANMLLRMETLRTAVIEALKVANEAEVVPSTLTATLLFDYINEGVQPVELVVNAPSL